MFGNILIVSLPFSDSNAEAGCWLMSKTDPYFYIPKSELVKGTLRGLDDGSTANKGFWFAKLTGGEKSTDRVVVFDSPAELKDLVRIEVSSLDAWFSEDEKLLGPHPKDPYKRVEILPSSREIRIEVDGTVVAKSAQNVFLFETMLRPRYYLGPTTVDWSFLRESVTETYCPYKGMAK
jgi:hypothetical protein